eukprot:208922-Pyramimonas_sp.AAC.1
MNFVELGVGGLELGQGRSWRAALIFCSSADFSRWLQTRAPARRTPGCLRHQSARGRSRQI